MTGWDVERAIFKYLNTNYSDTPIDNGSPSSFDPEAEDVTDWILWMVEDLVEHPTRKRSLRTGRIRLLIHCWSKNRVGVKPAKATAEAIGELFRHLTLSVTDLDDEEAPEIGFVNFFEPRCQDLTDQVEQGYACSVVTIEGFAQES